MQRNRMGVKNRNAVCKPTETHGQERGMRVIVTGATGFIGKYLVQELFSQKDHVLIITRDILNIPQEWRENAYVLASSLEELPQLKISDFPWSQADVFFHLAWSGTSGDQRADEFRQIQNIIHVCNAITLAKRLNCKRFVNAGSIMEYEAMRYIPSAEAAPGLPYLYSAAKLAADFMAKTLAVNKEIEYINLIISNIYGPGEHAKRFINTVLKKMLRNEKIPLTHGMQLYDFIYITDAVKEIILAAKKGEKNSAYYIGSKQPQKLKNYVLQMRKTLNSTSELLFGAIPFQGKSLTYDEFDIGKIFQLGFIPEVTFEQGICLLRDWILEEENEYQF